MTFFIQLSMSDCIAEKHVELPFFPSAGTEFRVSKEGLGLFVEVSESWWDLTDNTGWLSVEPSNEEECGWVEWLAGEGWEVTILTEETGNNE